MVVSVVLRGRWFILPHSAARRQGRDVNKLKRSKMATKQIKRYKDTDEYNPERLAELKRCKNDPVYFLKTYVTIQHPTRGPVPLKRPKNICRMTIQFSC